MKCIETICLFLKQYISEEQFEDIFYNYMELFESSLEKDIYLEILATNFSSKEERISLKSKLKNYVLNNDSSELENVNDAYIERMIDSDDGDTITEILKKKYEKKEEVNVDCSRISTRAELIKEIKRALGFPKFCGNNWDAIEDLIYDIVFPKKIVFSEWNEIEKRLPDDATIFRKILEENNDGRCKIFFT